MGRVKPSSLLVEKTKKYLQQFSKNLKRDFLCNLVKLVSREKGIRTIRDDWRTKNGALSFITKHWSCIAMIYYGDNFISWYLNNYNKHEKLLSNKKTLHFLFDNYDKIKNDLEDNDFLENLSADKSQLTELPQACSTATEEFELCWQAETFNDASSLFEDFFM